MKHNHSPAPETPLGQKWLTLLFLLPAAGLDIVYVIFLNCFLKLLKFCSLIILLKVFIDVVRHLQVLCFSADNVAYGPVGTAGKNQMFQTSRNQELFLHISISRGQYLQPCLYSSFLQDYGSLSHPARKLQSQGQQAVQYRQNPPPAKTTGKNPRWREINRVPSKYCLFSTVHSRHF